MHTQMIGQDVIDNDPLFSVYLKDIIQGDGDKSEGRKGEPSWYSDLLRLVYCLSGSIEGKLCLCLEASELAPCLGQFIPCHGEEDHIQQIEMDQ